MDPKTTALLVKIVALFDSPNQGERNNAFTKAQELLEKQGQSMADVLEALTALGVRAPAMTGFIDRTMGRKPAGSTAEAMPEHAERHGQSAPPKDRTESRADVIARYGSVEAVLQPCRWEVLLRSSVRHVSTFHAPPNERWTRSIHGYTAGQAAGRARNRAAQAIAQAYPLPETMQDALTEHTHWEQRDRELQRVLQPAQGPAGNESRLDLTAALRWELVRNLIRSELPVLGEAELQSRLQFWIDERQEAIDGTTLDEVKHLAEMVGRDLGSAIMRSGNATSVLFARWVCDVVVPAMQVPGRSRARANLTFDALLRSAMRVALTEAEPQRPE